MPQSDGRAAPAPPAADSSPEYVAAPVLRTEKSLKRQTRRDLLLYAVGMTAAAAGFWWLLPADSQMRVLGKRRRDFLDSLEARAGISSRQAAARKEALLDGSLTFDDDVAEALYSPTRSVPTYDRTQVTPNLRNNYNGQTPDPAYIPEWKMTLRGLASGKTEQLDIQRIESEFSRREQITRLVCVEGWSAVAWWGGPRFVDFLTAYPPAGGARWAKLESSLNLDSDGNPDPYYVSIDLDTARHPQSLLATHQNGAPLTAEHGAPLRLIAPVKLGLKNIKAITAITYTREQPADYWNDRGYSKYDGI